VDLATTAPGARTSPNAARATMRLAQHRQPTTFFKLALGKRAQRADFVDAHGNPCKSILVRHSKTGICWELATDEDQEKLEFDRDARQIILSILPPEGTMCAVPSSRKSAIRSTGR